MNEKEKLLEDFKEYLLENNFKPGDELDTELNLAKHFGVSRGAMREIIMYLSHLGIVNRIKNRGTFIKKFTYEKLEELMFFCFQLSGFTFEELKEARLYMELTIMPLIIKRITPEHITVLKKNIEDMSEAVNVPEKADALDREFHIHLFKICGNRTLRIFSNVILLLFRREYREKFLNPEAAEKSANDHKALLDAIMAEDIEKSCKLVRSHIIPT